MTNPKQPSSTAWVVSSESGPRKHTGPHRHIPRGWTSEILGYFDLQSADRWLSELEVWRSSPVPVLLKAWEADTDSQPNGITGVLGELKAADSEQVDGSSCGFRHTSICRSHWRRAVGGMVLSRPSDYAAFLLRVTHAWSTELSDTPPLFTLACPWMQSYFPSPAPQPCAHTWLREATGTLPLTLCLDHT